MKQKNAAARMLKYMGNSITALAVILLLKTISKYEADYSIIVSNKNIFFFILILSVYILLVVFGGIPWMCIVNVLTGSRISYSEVMFIYVRSNLLKYVPGNVFQYAGRNELASVKGLRHAAVGLATLVDVACYIFSAVLLAAVLAGDEFREFMYSRNAPGWNVKMTAVIFIAAAVTVLLLMFGLKRKKKLPAVISRLFCLRFWSVLVFNFIFYAITGVIAAGLYTALFFIVSMDDYSLHKAAVCTGSMLAATVIGFITPGSPGGVGIRETVALLLLKGLVDEPVILSGAVIMRSLSIIGDFFAFVAAWLWKIQKVKRNNRKRSTMTKQCKGFLIREGDKYRINSRITSSILVNQLHIDLLEKYKGYIKGKLLDAGCGEKPYSLLYDSLTVSSIGCDVESCMHNKDSIDVYASVDDLPFEDGEFDTVLCTNVLEHAAEAGKGFHELSRCLKDGGSLILSTPFLSPMHEAPYDFYRYTVYGLKHQLEKNGLVIEKIVPIGGAGLMMMVYFNYFVTRMLCIKVFTSINCFLQKVFYKIYKKMVFQKICTGVGRISAILSLGYFVIAVKKSTDGQQEDLL